MKEMHMRVSPSFVCKCSWKPEEYAMDAVVSDEYQSTAVTSPLWPSKTTGAAVGLSTCHIKAY